MYIHQHAILVASNKMYTLLLYIVNKIITLFLTTFKLITKYYNKLLFSKMYIFYYYYYIYVCMMFQLVMDMKSELFEFPNIQISRFLDFLF